MGESTTRDCVPSETDPTGSRRSAHRSRPRSRRSRPPPEPEGIPIVDRETGRVLSVLAAGRRRIVEVGTAYGYSTLWLALGQPADGTIVTIDPDRSRTDLARGWWRQAGIADERITVVNAPALEAFAAGRRAGARRAVRPGVHRRAQAGVRAATSRRSCPGSRRARSSSPTTSCGAGEVSGARPVRAGRRRPRPSARSTRPSCRPALHRHDPAGRRRAARSPRYRG